MRRRGVSLLAAFAAGLVTTAGWFADSCSADSVSTTSQALELSKKTGRPVLAVAGSET
jgi:hypothetical protein